MSVERMGSESHAAMVPRIGSGRGSTRTAGSIRAAFFRGPRRAEHPRSLQIAILAPICVVAGLSGYFSAGCCTEGAMEPVAQYAGTVECCDQVNTHNLGVDSPEELIITLRWDDPTVDLDLRVFGTNVERVSRQPVGGTSEQVRMPAALFGAQYTIEVTGDAAQAQDYQIQVVFESDC